MKTTILWLTGVDRLLTYGLGENGYELSTETKSWLFKKLFGEGSFFYSHLKGLPMIRKTKAEVTPFENGILIKTKDKCVALIDSINYTPKKMEQDVTCYGIAHIIFIQTPKSPCYKFVKVAKEHGFKFIKWVMPELVFEPDYTQNEKAAFVSQHQNDPGVHEIKSDLICLMQQSNGMQPNKDNKERLSWYIKPYDSIKKATTIIEFICALSKLIECIMSYIGSI